MNTRNYFGQNFTAVLLCLITIMFLLSCVKQNVSPTTPIMEKPDTTAVIKYLGEFINGPYGNVTGTARVHLVNGKYILELKNISVTNGPDLHVYLSRQVMPVSFIDLGRLRSTRGNQLYDIPGMPDFSAYRYALIHCQQYNHLFGSAAL